MNGKFYYLHFDNEDDLGGVAYCVSEEIYKASSQIKFELRDGYATDYLANDLGFPLFSERMKKRLQELIHNSPVIWVPTEIVASSREVLRYYLVKFPYFMDVLDKEKTMYTGNGTAPIVIKACLSMGKIDGLEIFPISENDTRIVVFEKAKDVIESMGFSGVRFSIVSASK